jgi:hypothetical protein
MNESRNESRTPQLPSAPPLFVWWGFFTHGRDMPFFILPALPLDNPLFPFPDRLSSVFSALGEKANS